MKIGLIILFLLTTISSTAQRKRDIVEIEELIISNQIDSAFGLLINYCNKFPDEKNALQHLGIIYYQKAQKQFNAFQLNKKSYCLFNPVDSVRIQTQLHEVDSFYIAAIDLLKKANYNTYLYSDSFVFRPEDAGYYFGKGYYSGNHLNDFGVKISKFDKMNDDIIWNYNNWYNGWQNAIKYWHPYVISQYIRIFNEIRNPINNYEDCYPNLEEFKIGNRDLFLLDNNVILPIPWTNRHNS